MTRTTFLLAPLAVVAACLPWACSGPQPLDVAIRAEDQRAFDGMLAAHGAVPRDGFLEQRAAEQFITVAEARAADDAISTTKNPFDAKRDLVAVSRGAVIYKSECIACHGASADGRGPLMPEAPPSMDFHRFGMRFAVTLHGGAPKSWFRTISDGTLDHPESADASDASLPMPPYADRLAREQIWLVITYLQSLDKDATASAGGADL